MIHIMGGIILAWAALGVLRWLAQTERVKTFIAVLAGLILLVLL
jgi:hypothetical protein